MKTVKVNKEIVISVRIDIESFADLMRLKKPNESRSIFLRRMVKDFINRSGEYSDRN